MSMDGNNRTVIIGVDPYSYDVILALTLDYQAQVFYWIFGHHDNHSLIIKRSSSDGTDQQVILQLRDVHFDYFIFDRHSFAYLSGITVYNDTLFLSLSWPREVYKVGINGENFSTLFINDFIEVFCIFDNSQLKVTSQPSG